MAISQKAWTQFTSADYKDAATYCDACLINMNTGKREGWTKDACKLPVKEPNGDVNANALSAAAAALAGARGGVQAPAAEKQKAARALARLYGMAKMPMPQSLQLMVK